MTRRLTALVALCAALAGCGGDDRKEAEQVVRDFVRATNERDGDTLCDEVLSQDYLEKSTGATGDRAAEACKEQLKAVRGLELELVGVRSASVDGDEATVVAELEAQGQPRTQRFALEKDGSDWKLAGGSGE